MMQPVSSDYLQALELADHVDGHDLTILRIAKLKCKGFSGHNQADTMSFAFLEFISICMQG